MDEKLNALMLECLTRHQAVLDAQATLQGLIDDVVNRAAEAAQMVDLTIYNRLTQVEAAKILVKIAEIRLEKAEKALHEAYPDYGLPYAEVAGALPFEHYLAPDMNPDLNFKWYQPSNEMVRKYAYTFAGTVENFVKVGVPLEQALELAGQACDAFTGANGSMPAYAYGFLKAIQWPLADTAYQWLVESHGVPRKVRELHDQTLALGRELRAAHEDNHQTTEE